MSSIMFSVWILGSLPVEIFWKLVESCGDEAQMEEYGQLGTGP